MQSLEGEFEMIECKRNSEGCLGSRNDEMIVGEMAVEVADSLMTGCAKMKGGS